MASVGEEKEPLMCSEEEFMSSEQHDRKDLALLMRRKPRSALHRWCIYVVLMIAISLNIGQYLYYTRSLASHLDGGRSPYGRSLCYSQRRERRRLPEGKSVSGLTNTLTAGVRFDTEKVYHMRSEYSPEDPTTADQLWTELDTDHANIALTNDEAERLGVPIDSVRFPWDRSRGIYVVKVFHHLHCLKSIRETVVRYERGLQPIVPWSHVHHCLDALRQDTTCLANDTPMWVDPVTGMVGEGQVSQCRDLDAVVRWVETPELYPCYRSLSDYRTENHTLERYAFCPDNSPYKSTMEAYFAKWGHQEAFLNDGKDTVAAGGD